MKIPLYQIDAFTNELFRGNPAAVCPLDQWLEDKQLQLIAAENNLSETAFFVGGNGSYDLRWFTPEMEVDLCGHATLASGFCIFNYLETNLDRVNFQTKSGLLTVKKEDALLSMDFPARRARPCSPPGELIQGLGLEPQRVLRARDYLVVYDSEEKIRALRPHMNLLSNVDCLGIIVTSVGADSDFVSRFFAPRAGIDEDPVTGSAHCTLIPYWSEKLNKKKLHARQLSSRGGELFCEDLGDRVKISGQAVSYLEGHINL